MPILLFQSPAPPTEKTVLAIDPGLKKTFGYVVCRDGLLLARGTFNIKDESLQSLASKLLTLCQEHQVTLTVIERFRFFSGPPGTQANRTGTAANGATIVKMTEVVFYLYGFLNHLGIEVRLETPNVWKKAVEPQGREELTRKLAAFAISRGFSVKKEDAHWLDAFGLYLFSVGLQFQDGGSIELHAIKEKLKMPKPQKPQKSKAASGSEDTTKGRQHGRRQAVKHRGSDLD